MKLQTPFDASQYDPSQGMGQLSLGRHPVVIDSSEVKATKEGNAGYLQLNLRVIEGPGAGETGAMRFNLYHSNAKTVEIAHKQLSAVCHVTGVFSLADSTQLHNIPFVVEVGSQSDPKYTEVKRVFDMRGNEPQRAGTGAPQGAAQPQQAPQQAPQQPAWGGQQPQQAPQQAPAQAAPWGAPQQTPTQPAPGVAPQAWGQPAQQAPQHAPQHAPAPQGQQAPAAPAWAQTPGGAPAAQPNGAPPWGQPR